MLTTKESDTAGWFILCGTICVMVAFIAWIATGCAEMKPVARTVNDVARDLCAIFYGKKQGITIDEAARAFCATEKQIAPFLDEVLAAEQRAGMKATAAAQDAGSD